MVKSFRRKNVHRVRRKSARNHHTKLGANAKELGMMGAVLGFSALQTISGTEHEGAAGAGAGAGAQEFMAGGRGGSKGRNGKSLDASVLILTFMEMLNTIKIFHWSTLSYPSHKATDELHSKMSELVDSFIEKYIGGVGGGKTPVFHDRGGHNIPFCECKSLEHFRTKLAEYKTFLVSLTERLDGVTELLNIRDEMIGEIDQAVYLLRLK